MIAWMLVGCGLSGGSVVTVAPPAVPVEVALAEDGRSDESWRMGATVRARQYARLAAGATGELRQVMAEEGVLVDEGALLAELDDGLIRAQIDRARAEADLASAAGDYKAGALKLAVSELSVQLVRHTVRAPFQGIVAARYVDVGDWVFMGDPVVDLVSVGEVEVVVDAPGELIGDVQPGAAAAIVGRDTVIGEVLAVVPVQDPVTHLVRVRVRPGEPRDWLVHGAATEVRLPITRATDGVVVPTSAVAHTEVGPMVIKAAGNRAVRVPITRLAWTDDLVLVEGAGLSAGDAVVLSAPDRLYTGQLLDITDGL